MTFAFHNRLSLLWTQFGCGRQRMETNQQPSVGIDTGIRFIAFPMEKTHVIFEPKQPYCYV